MRTGVQAIGTLSVKSRGLIANTMGVCFTRGMDLVSLHPDAEWKAAFGGATSHGQSPQGRSFRLAAVLMRFDELKVEDSRLLRFDSKPETGHPGPIPSRAFAASGDDGRIAGHQSP